MYVTYRLLGVSCKIYTSEDTNWPTHRPIPRTDNDNYFNQKVTPDIFIEKQNRWYQGEESKNKLFPILFRYFKNFATIVWLKNV